MFPISDPPCYLLLSFLHPTSRYRLYYMQKPAHNVHLCKYTIINALNPLSLPLSTHFYGNVRRLPIHLCTLRYVRKSLIYKMNTFVYEYIIYSIMNGRGYTNFENFPPSITLAYQSSEIKTLVRS